jgi:general secretion pathway protein K
MRPASRRRGIALPLVLWGIAFLSGIVILVAVRMSERIDEESKAERTFRARQMALRGLALASNPQIEKWDPILRSGSPEEEGYEVRISDESGRISPNHFLQSGDRTALLNLFASWEVDPRLADAAVDSLTDWLDPDSLRSLAGAEAPEYAAAGLGGLPPNSAFGDVREMEYVLNARDVLAARPGWQNLFTVTYDGPINVNFAEADVLAGVAQLDPEQIARMQSFMAGADGQRDTKDDVQFESVEDAVAISGAFGPQALALERFFGVEGGMRRIDSTGYCGGLRRTISAIVGEGGREILAWEER